jgi:hypothetical protein
MSVRIARKITPAHFAQLTLDSLRMMRCRRASRAPAAPSRSRAGWLRVYMRSKLIKHNKDLFECIDDPFALLDKLHIY